MPEEMWGPLVQRMGEAECWPLISGGGVGRLAYDVQFGMTVFPVRYEVNQGSVEFPIAPGSPPDEDLRTGIPGAEYRVCFEIDDVGQDAAEGWFVLVQGDAHHVDLDADRAPVTTPGGVRPPAGGRHLLRITPARVSGRRLRRG